MVEDPCGQNHRTEFSPVELADFDRRQSQIVSNRLEAAVSYLGWAVNIATVLPSLSHQIQAVIAIDDPEGHYTNVIRVLNQYH